MIYLNCAATSLMRPACVVDAVAEALTGLGSSSRGTAACDLAAARSALTCRMAVADLFGSEHPERVIFTANATQALNTAIFGLVRPKERVVTTVMEHNSVLRPLNVLERDARVEVEHMGLTSEGALDYAALEEAVTPGTRLVVCTHASNLTGDVVDIARVARIAHAVGALIVVDAAQSAGVVPIDVTSMGIDVLCFTGHKALMGPTGTGGLVVVPGVDIAPLLSGGTGVHSADPFQPRAWPEHLEAGTLNGHGLAGLEAAVRFVTEQGVEAIHAHDERLRARFFEGVSAVEGVHVYGAGARNVAEPNDGQPASRSCHGSNVRERGDRMPVGFTRQTGTGNGSILARRCEASIAPYAHTPVVALNLDGWASSELSDVLAERYGIATRAGLHCAPLMHRALGTLKSGSVRFSFGYFTTEKDIDAALAALRELADEGRGR